jgi:hypothetical protein
MAQRIMLRRLADLDHKENLAKRIAGIPLDEITKGDG